MSEKAKLGWVYAISILFVLLNTFLITKEMYWAMLAPLLLMVALLYIFSLDKLLLVITFFTPLSVFLQSADMGIRIALPTEPLLFGVLLLFFVKLFFDGIHDTRISRHIVSIAILINLLWLLITSITSELPLVSIKFLISRLWFIIPFYFLGIRLFSKSANIGRFLWLYIIPLLGVIFYTIYKHSLFGFDEDPGHWVMSPFYNDHTAYGAILAMFFPVVAGFTLSKEHSMQLRVVSFLVLLILIVALILSYSRATWLSVAASIMVYVLVIMKIKFRWVAITTVAIIAGLMIFQQVIVETLEKNKQDSSADFVEHIQSMYNISTDASNLERINRWQSAFRMYHERPFWGWGPGTYQFLYAPYQQSQEKTIISTNAGDLGNAHSEYIGPLAESGIFGALTFVFVVIVMLYTGFKVYHQARSKKVRMYAMVTVLGLISYFLHGFLNNFLDTDKASVPVWGFAAIIVALDIYHKKRPALDAGDREV